MAQASPQPAAEPTRCGGRCAVHGHRLSVTGPVTAEDIGRLCATVPQLLSRGETAVVLCDSDGPVAPDLATVEAITRLHLAAKRRGGQVRVCAQRHDLRALLALTGLAEVIVDCRGAGSVGQLDR